MSARRSGCGCSRTCWRSLRYGRLSSFHTYLSKVVANLLGLFIGWLFLFGFEPWLLYVAAGASIVASLEEIALLSRAAAVAGRRARPVVGVAGGARAMSESQAVGLEVPGGPPDRPSGGPPCGPGDRPL